MKKTVLALLALIFLVSTSFKEVSDTTDFEEILKQSDFYRGGRVPGISWDLEVQNIEEGNLRNKLNLKVEATTNSESQYALISFLKPKKYDGQKLLLRGNNMWFVKRGMRRPVPISGRQRLSGSAANADAAAANYFLDYDIINTSSETIEGKACWKLELIAKKNLVSYSKIIYWISKEESFGLKADFFGKSGKLIKTGYFDYENKVTYENKSYKYISKITIIDKINTKDKTILDIVNPAFEAYSNAKFQKNSLLE
ncbi:outer membrane lipoprotein-sorting protein [Flavivirga jejuensis]|uniref:Outer membrane lipoprotein-sorting protein n=1 Tax=Flavivirga jejuensis TaxID=870487 RepID=A0ABT8WN07_9FLAO|nr:outer membrane lipoprotein-sorting protein [Flavivirga jejuensis]MDO5974410.1 outer membrane lipoprotein-sorting protein [Flavivirga jejuensis]